MRHFTPPPISDDRDHWLMIADDRLELVHSERDVLDDMVEHGQWWSRIIRFNSGENTCRDVTADFVTDEDEDDSAAGIPTEEELLREYHGRVL